MQLIHTHRRQVAAAIRFVRENGNASISLETLAETAGASPFHFDRVFRRMTGMGAIRYVRSFRLSQAAVELVQSNRRVIDIAFSAGYANHESFSRAFRMEFKTSPRAYRNKNRLSRLQNQREITMKNLGISFGFVKIPVTQFAKSAAFYRDVLGLEEQFAVEQYGWAQYDVGGTGLCLYQVGMGGGQGKPGIDTGIQLRVNDAKAAHALITQRGGTTDPIHTGDDGTIGFSVTDPDGNTLSIAQVPAE
jgi:AraC-like DNA-binding protein/catechol 2,3-dioxygenase-like lactoylglutathione lyase family enzyme